jgi:putative membrane protein insertion efficiency factor
MYGLMRKENDSAGRLPQAASRRKPGAAMLLGVIRLYQLTFAFFLGRRCRHLPSCSNYAMEAIRRHGGWAGFLLGLFRVLRCHPWGTSGFDPVPEDVPRSPFAFGAYWRISSKDSLVDPRIKSGDANDETHRFQ